jgi:hypothetical protein
VLAAASTRTASLSEFLGPRPLLLCHYCTPSNLLVACSAAKHPLVYETDLEPLNECGPLLGAVSASLGARTQKNRVRITTGAPLDPPHAHERCCGPGW